MAYNTKNILRSGDASPIPIPQFYNPTEDAFNPLTGANLGSGRYGADGVMWGKTAGGVYIPVQVNANGEVLTQLSGSKIADAQAVPSRQQNKVEIITLLNAVSVPVFNAGDLAGTTALANLDYKGANEVYVAVNIDKQPWSAGVKTWTDYVAEGQRLFPSLKNITQTFINPHVYKLALIYSDINAIETIDNYEKALRAAYYPPGESGIRIYNKSSEVATCTVKLIRVWR